jgi:hypothetical protein
MEMGKSSMSLFDDIIKVQSKEILEELDNIKQINITILSAWTRKNQQNTRVLAPSGEGKTYLVTKDARYFPQENIFILAKATPQSFKYALSSRRVVENGPGNWQEYEVAIQPIDEELSKTKDPQKKKELEKAKRELVESACDEIDFTNKVIILVDDQSFEFFEAIKTTLSHDQESLLSFSVNKTKSGTMKGQKFRFKGWPAVIYCSAKDEQKKDQTNEINTRFNTIALNTSPRKYRKMLHLQSMRSSLPDSIYQKEVLSDDEIEQTREKILQLIEIIKKNDEIINPYGEGISKLLPEDGGFRTRQLKILDSNIAILTLVRSESRCKIIVDGNEIPITTREIIEEACSLIKEQREIQSYKIKFFNDHIKPAILHNGEVKDLITGQTKCLSVSQIRNIINKKGITTTRQKIQETFLKPLSDNGFLDFFKDPDNHSQYLYAVTQGYLEKDATVESTLIDTSLLDVSCVNSFVKKYIEQRFEKGELEIQDAEGNNITPSQLLDILHKIDAQTLQNRHELGSNDASKSIDGEEK